jgi:N-acetylneuraminate lyase
MFSHFLLSQIGMMASSFFRPATVDALVEWSSLVAAAAPNLPFFYYHIPSMTNVDFNMYDFLQAGQSKIPTLAGVKFTDYDLYTFARCAHFGYANTTQHGPFTMLFGRDEVLLGGLAMQANGAVGSTYNYMGNIGNALIAAFQKGDMATAQEQQARIQAIVTLLGKYGGEACGKAIMQMIGVPVGPPRPPSAPLTTAQYDQLKHDLDGIGFFNWV